MTVVVAAADAAVALVVVDFYNLDMADMWVAVAADSVDYNIGVVTMSHAVVMRATKPD